jgi:hypothetical protein
MNRNVMISMTRFRDSLKELIIELVMILSFLKVLITLSTLMILKPLKAVTPLLSLSKAISNPAASTMVKSKPLK